MEDCFINSVINDIKQSKKYNEYYLSNNYLYLESTNDEYILNIIKNHINDYYILELINYFIIPPFRLYNNQKILYVLQYKLPIKNINYYFNLSNDLFKYLLNTKFNKYNIISCESPNKFIIIDNIIIKNNDKYNYFIFNIEKKENIIFNENEYNIENPTNKLREYIYIDIF
jgi:hypothetical protein